MISRDNERDWQRLRRHLPAPERDAVTEFDVVRLRRSVSKALGEQSRTRWPARLVAAAASLAVVALGLFGLQPGPDLGAEDSPFRVQRAKDGSVVIDFLDGRAEHKVQKIYGPRVDGISVIASGKGSRYEDRDGQPRPGSVVFYKID